MVKRSQRACGLDLMRREVRLVFVGCVFVVCAEGTRQAFQAFGLVSRWDSCV